MNAPKQMQTEYQEKIKNILRRVIDLHIEIENAKIALLQKQDNFKDEWDAILEEMDHFDDGIYGQWMPRQSLVQYGGELYEIKIDLSLSRAPSVENSLFHHMSSLDD